MDKLHVSASRMSGLGSPRQAQPAGSTNPWGPEVQNRFLPTADPTNYVGIMEAPQENEEEEEEEGEERRNL